jgi:hypothetical protein
MGVHCSVLMTTKSSLGWNIKPAATKATNSERCHIRRGFGD